MAHGTREQEEYQKSLLSYPDTPLGPQLRPFEETQSVFEVIRDEFFPDLKPTESS